MYVHTFAILTLLVFNNLLQLVPSPPVIFLTLHKRITFATLQVSYLHYGLIPPRVE